MSNALFDEMARRLDLDKEEEEDDTLEPFKDPLFNELAERMGRLPKGTGRREKMRAKSAEVGPAPPKETAAQKREKRAMTSMTLPTPEERKELDEGGMRAQAQDALRRTVGLPPRAAQKYGQKKAQEMIDKAKPDGGQQAETWRTGPTGHLAERAAISMAPGPEGAAPPEEKGVRERLMSAAASNISGLAQSAAGAMGGFANLEPEEVAGGPWGGLAGPIAAVLEPFQRGIANGMLKPTEATAQFLEEALGLDPQNSFEKRFKENPFLAGAEAGLSNIHSFAATLAASAAGAAIAGPAGMMMGGLGAAGGQAYGNAYQGAKQAGFDETTSQQVAILSSLGEMGLEYFPAAKLLKIAKTPAARAGLARVAGAAMQQATFEFGTEITQESWNIVVEAMASLDEQGIQWEQFGQNLPPDAFWRVAEAGIAGAMLGGTAGGVGGVVAPEMREEGPPPEAGQLALPPGPSPSSLGLPPGPPPRALLTEGMQLPPQGRPAGPSDQGPAGLLPRAIASQAPDPMSMLQPELPDTIPPAQGGPGAIDQLGTAVGPPWDPGLTVPPTPEPPPPPGPKKAYKAPAVLVATAMPPKRPIPPSDPLTLGLGPQRVPGEPVISAIDALTPAQRTDYPELEDDLGDPLDALDQLSPENRPTETLDTAIGPPWDPDLTLEDLVQETPFNVLSGVPEKRMPPYVYVPMDVNDPEDIAGRVWYHGAGPGFSDLGEADPLRVGDYAALIGAGLHLTDSQELGETYRELRAKQQAWDIAVKEMREAGMSGEELLEGPGQEALLKRVNEIQKELGAVLAGKLPGTIRLVDMEQRLDDEAYAAFQEYYEGLDWKVAGQTQLPREATGMDLFNMLHQATTMELSRKKPDFDEIMDNLAPLTLKLQGLLMNRGYHGYKHEGGNLIGGGQQNHNVVILWGDPWQRFGKLAGGIDAKRGTMRQPADPWGRPGRGGPAGGRPGPTPVPEAPPAAEAPVEEAPVEPEAAPKKKPKPAEPEEIVDLTHPLSGRPLEEVELPDIDSANGEVDSAQDELGNSWSYLWAVVDLGDVVPSHDEETRKANPFYDQKLQRRGRGRVTSENQVEAISKDPRGFFDDGSRIGQGAPILNKQGQVLDGNGRVMGLLRKLRLGTYEEFSDQVRAKAADYGITIPEDMENPVLVRIAETTDPAEQSELARVANIGQGAAMAAAEKGMQDAELLTAEDLALYDPELQEGLLAAGNKDFVTAFMSHIPQTEHGAMLTSEANLSKEGLTRIKNAVMARAFPDSDLLELLQESEDNEIRNIGRAFEAAGAPMAQMAAAIEEGSLQDVPIAEEATNAAIKLRDLRKAEQKVPDYLATAQIGDRELSSDEESLLTLFDKWRNAPNKVADFLKAYAAELRDEGDPGQATLTPRPKPTRAELIDRAAERMGAQKSLLEAPTPPKKVPSKKDRLKQELAERRAKKTQKKAEPEAEAKAAPKMRDDKAQARGKAIADTHRAAWGEPDPSKAALSIVGCCKAKGKVRTKAAELYKSALYKLSRKWAERGGRTMVIASAQHGLVPSDREIDPYDTALKAKADKERYAAKVRSDVAFMLEKYPNLTEVEILAGEAYAVPLRAELEKHGIAVTEPLKGLAVGQRLKWLRSPPKAKSPDEAMADDAIEAIEAAKTKPAKEGAEATENLKRERAAMKARTDKEKKAKAKAAKPRANKVLKRWLGGALGQSVADMLGSLHIPGVGLYNTLVKIGFPVNDLEIETDEKGQVKISLAGEYAGFVSKQDRGMIKVEVAMIARRWALENQAEEEVAPEAETEPIPEPDEFELTGEPVAEEASRAASSSSRRSSPRHLERRARSAGGASRRPRVSPTSRTRRRSPRRRSAPRTSRSGSPRGMPSSG